MSSVRFLIAAAALAFCGWTSAAAEGARVALVIGNSGYDGGFLPNPVNDANLVSQKLEAVGFAVTTLVDANENEMERAIVNFTVELQDAGRDSVGFFYYAGHGVQSSGENYLIPVGSNIERRADLGVEAVRLNWLVDQLTDTGNRVNFIVLDACRNNPLPKSIFRSSGTGLAQLDAPVGTFIGYSTAPGTVAEDGTGSNSPYAAALAQVIETPDLPAELVFKRIRDAVIDTTHGFQVPWDASSLAGDDFFFVVTHETHEETTPDGVTTTDTTTTITPVVSDNLGGDRIELAFWESIKDSTNAADFDAYLERYGSGVFATLARNRLEALRPSAGMSRGSETLAPADLTVDINGSGDFTSIQDAINAAEDGDVIHVMPGTYVEDVVFSEDERISIIGLSSGENRPKIVADEFRPIEVNAGDPTIENFIFESDKADYAAVWVPGGRPKLRRNTFRVTTNSCLWAEGSAAPIVQENEIGPCGSYGVRIMGDAGGIYEGNNFSQVSSHAIYLSDNARASFLNNNIGRTGDSAIYIEGTASSSFTENVIQPGDVIGMMVLGEASPTVRSNQFRGGDRGIAIADTATGVYEANDISRTDQQAIVVYGSAAPSVVGNDLHDVPGNCIHITQSASGDYEGNNLRGCGLPPEYPAISIDTDATDKSVTVAGNTVLGPGYPLISNLTDFIDVSDNEVRE